MKSKGTMKSRSATFTSAESLSPGWASGQQDREQTFLRKASHTNMRLRSLLSIQLTTRPSRLFLSGLFLLLADSVGRSVASIAMFVCAHVGNGSERPSYCALLSPPAALPLSRTPDTDRALSSPFFRFISRRCNLMESDPGSSTPYKDKDNSK